MQAVRQRSVHENALIETALRYLGVRYRQHAGPDDAADQHLKDDETPESGFCCSGLIRVVAHEHKIMLPPSALNSRLLYSNLQSTNSPQDGDLVFYSKYGFSCDHVGILTPQGVLHASRTLGKVVISTLDEIHAIYARTIRKSGRLYQENPIGYRSLANA